METPPPYLLLEFEIGFVIGKAAFLVNNHFKMFEMMRIKKIDELEALVVYEDFGLCKVKFGFCGKERARCMYGIIEIIGNDVS